MSRLIVVVNNQVAFGPLMGEHGLSIWLEHRGLNILYDTGAGRALMPNLESLQMDPNKLDAAVLSHGHFDHTGGLAQLLQARSEPLTVYCHPAVFASHVHALDDGTTMEIGPPLGSQAAYEAIGARFQMVTEPVSPWPGVTLLAPIPRVTEFEGPAPGLFSQRDGDLIPDPFDDDLAMLVEGDEGFSVVTGCAHAGAINVLLAAEDAAGGPVRLLVGGTHLGPAPARQQRHALGELKRRAHLYVAAGHCTGAEMEATLARELGERFIPLEASLAMQL
jgi:7,8-dihydropterin-6-yl-methyl-4-(beta-D-ribofuranosyl)aminobenzene 5'-phosphate synthase